MPSAANTVCSLGGWIGGQRHTVCHQNAGILIDAVVVRCLLVPALVALFGRANWWLPAPLAWVLRIPALPAQPAQATGSARPAVALAADASGQAAQDQLVLSDR